MPYMDPQGYRDEFKGTLWTNKCYRWWVFSNFLDFVPPKLGGKMDSHFDGEHIVLKLGIPGDSKGPFYPQTLEVTNNL